MKKIIFMFLLNIFTIVNISASNHNVNINHIKNSNLKIFYLLVTVIFITMTVSTITLKEWLKKETLDTMEVVALNLQPLVAQD